MSKCTMMHPFKTVQITNVSFPYLISLTCLIRCIDFPRVTSYDMGDCHWYRILCKEIARCDGVFHMRLQVEFNVVF